MENNNSFNNIPVWLIVLLFIFFWPLGIILLILKLSNKNVDKIETLKNKKIMNVVVASIAFFLGLVFILIAVVGIGEIANGYSDSGSIGALVMLIIFISVCVVLGVWRCKKAVTINNTIKKINMYQTLIIVRELYDLNEIASNMKISKSEVLEDISNYIREGYLYGIRIKQNKIEKIVDPNKIFNVNCPSCGANNKCIQGKENKCVYCGTILNFSKVDIR